MSIVLMRAWLTAQPVWVLSVVTGLPFAAIMSVLNGLQGDGWATAVITGVLGGVVFGALMGPFFRRMVRRQDEALGVVDPGVERAAVRALRRGPVPVDPQVRAAAVRLIDHQLAETARRRWLSVVALVAFVALSATLALTQSSWWWLAVGFWLALAALTVQVPRRLQKRRTQLLTAQDMPG